jgi:UDP-N-acetylmuramyl pentapeptide phosphotransferase/UDP-N-acetylglucosamine-1-phosphate transferase
MVWEWGIALGLLVVGIGIVNAYNLLDGLDGLALGTGLLAASPFFFAAWQGRSPGGIAITLAFLAAGTGLLRGNLHPARIFLGDAGSLLLGGVVFAVPLYGPHDIRLTDPNLVGAYFAVVLGVPCIDMLMVMWGRFRRGVPLTRGDRTHLHHRLQRAGFSHEGAVGIIHLAMGLLVLLHTLLVATHRPMWWIAFASPLWIAGYVLLARLERHGSATINQGVRHAS